MSKRKESKGTVLNWDEFRLMGNPVESESENELMKDMPSINMNDRIRIFLDRKSRGGKFVTLIKGLSCNELKMLEYSKTLKLSCGVGGSLKDSTILLQGNQRNKALLFFQEKGYKDVKFSGG